MVPPFQSGGYLPPGIHRASLDEIEARFGQGSELRKVQMESLRWLAEKDEREVEVTREKLRSLEARYLAVSQNPQDDAHIQELTLRSLRRWINQMKEEIARFEARGRSRAARPSSPVGTQ